MTQREMQTLAMQLQGNPDDPPKSEGRNYGEEIRQMVKYNQDRIAGRTNPGFGGSYQSIGFPQGEARMTPEEIAQLSKTEQPLSVDEYKRYSMPTSDGVPEYSQDRIRLGQFAAGNRQSYPEGLGYDNNTLAQWMKKYESLRKGNLAESNMTPELQAKMNAFARVLQERLGNQYGNFGNEIGSFGNEIPSWVTPRENPARPPNPNFKPF